LESECDRPIVPLRGIRLQSGWGIWGDRVKVGYKGLKGRSGPKGLKRVKGAKSVIVKKTTEYVPETYTRVARNAVFHENTSLQPADSGKNPVSRTRSASRTA
jgi:hypothetical protein